MRKLIDSLPSRLAGSFAADAAIVDLTVDLSYFGLEGFALVAADVAAGPFPSDEAALAAREAGILDAVRRIGRSGL